MCTIICFGPDLCSCRTGHIAYNMTWTSEGALMRGTFAPTRGDIKPNLDPNRKVMGQPESEYSGVLV